MLILGLDDLEGLFQHTWFCDSMKCSRGNMIALLVQGFDHSMIPTVSWAGQAGCDALADSLTAGFSAFLIAWHIDTDTSSLHVSRQSKHHRQDRHLPYKGFLIPLFNTKWKQNKAQKAHLILHWCTFSSISFLHTSCYTSNFLFWVSCRDGQCGGTPVCRHSATQTHKDAKTWWATAD